MACLTDIDLDKFSNEGKILLIRNHRIYDVTKFSKSHPGGEDILRLYHGKDVTKVMKSGVHAHSDNAFQWLEQYYVGDYANGSVKNGLMKNGKLHQHSSSPAYSPNGKAVKDECPDLVNWNEPVLWQVGNMGAKYHEWIDNPVDKPLRLFKSDFVEFFSSTPWYVIPLVWIPVVAYFAYRSYSTFLAKDIYMFSLIPVPINSMPLFFLFGVFGWTFLEYVLHRWLFHRDPPTSSYFLITLHFLLHGQHHKVPFDSGRLVFPPVPAFILGFALYSAARLALVQAVTDILAAGLILGYVCYDLTHYYLHYGSPKKGSYFDRLRAYHVRHHFQSPHLGYGISSKLWDYPFNTLIKTTKKLN